MTATYALPMLSSAIILIFALLVLRRFAARRERHLLVWGAGLLMFGIASAAEAYSALAWSPVVFRLWYLGGAVLSAAWIGQGTAYLLAGERRRRLVSTLTWLLLGASCAAAYLVFTLPLDASRFDTRLPLSAQYRQIFPPGAPVRRLTPAFNIYGTLLVAGGALYSAWLLRRRRISPPRALGNVLIAAGALVIASASTLVRLGLRDILYPGQVFAAALMFAGFLLATSRRPTSGPAEHAPA